MGLPRHEIVKYKDTLVTLCSMHGNRDFLRGKNQGLFGDFQAPSRPFSKPIPTQFSARDSFYRIDSGNNTDFHYIAYSSPTTTPFFTQWGLPTILEFKHFQGPLMLKSNTFGFGEQIKWTR